MTDSYRKTLSPHTLFTGTTVLMALSLLAVIGLLFWWHRLIVHNLDTQYHFFRTQVEGRANVSAALAKYIRTQDEKLANIILQGKSLKLVTGAEKIISERLTNRRRMVLYEQTFFIFLLLSGHLFIIYIYFRERGRRKATEEIVLLATHEIRQPLQSLSLALETVEPVAKGKSLKAITDGLAEITKLNELIRWLARSFTSNAKSAITVLPSIREYIGQRLEADFSVGDRERIELSAPQAPACRAAIDEKYLRFLLRNLIENALKYSVGPISIIATLGRKRLSIIVENQTGTIGRQQFAKIGSVFYRSTESNVQNKSGFGLGLYLCGRIARAAHGRLLIEHNRQTLRVILTLRCA
ncbi:MAG: HAMP domain-containing histidine kinase [Spirochaetes bacterium]|nr:HAMP domain-containing histidine kinase [Spirochaetota bacterium]